MTLKGGTSQACAACKYQRKRCTPECPLAPHFRPEQTEIFKNAHKLFGVRNILRILEQVDPSQKNESMLSIIYQANMRDRSPVHGCLGVIYQLQYQIRQVEKELYVVFSQLELYKQHQGGQHEITLFENEVIDHNHNQQFVLSYNGNENQNRNEGYNTNSVIHTDSKENLNMDNAIWGQQPYYNENNDKSHLVDTQPMTIQEEATHDYDEIYPFFDTIDDTQSYIEANESSSDSSLKETKQSVQHVAGTKLKNAKLGIMSEDYQEFA